jgi:ATP-dependent DNA ligase
MPARRPVLWIGLFALTLMGPALAADLPLKPARPVQPAAAPASPATPAAKPQGPDAACLEWTDGCRVCQRAANSEVSCSNVGIACVPKAEECTRR